MSYRIVIDLPLHPRHASTARTVAVSIGADAGFSVDDLEDLRLGVNEAISVLTDIDAGDDARLILEFEQEAGKVTVVAYRTGVVTALHETDLDILAERILRNVVDEYGIDDAGAFLVVKRATHYDHA